MSAETVSSLFPDRPIRPLPKRRLRERLSPEVADSIQYPEPPKPTNSLFSYPFSLRNDESDVSLTRDKALTAGSKDLSPVEEEEVAALRQDLVDRSPHGLAGRITRPAVKTSSDQGRQTNPQLPHSATSSVDGYDLLENTNNKKKRKIPTTGDANLNSVHSLADIDIGPLTLSSPSHSTETYNETLVGSAQYHGPGNQGPGSQNLAGPGRGRYGRPRSGRSPLRPLSDSTNNWAGRNGKLRPPQWSSGASENLGIISTAIANAGKLPPRQGQENTSLLHREQTVKQNTASTQFTFTCGSQVPSVGWSQADRGPSAQSQQSAASRPINRNWPHSPPAGQANQAPLVGHEAGEPGAKEVTHKGTAATQNSAAPPQKTSRKSLAREYEAAAKARRRETQLYNKRHPPKPDEVWICHFCEYEAIYGHPPEALVRQYEMKDNKQRLLEQQRRAQWERMKKGKHKGKKSSKTPAKAGSGHDQQQPVDSHGAPMHSNYSQGTQSEEYYDDEYDDEGCEHDDDVPLESPHEIPINREPFPNSSVGASAAHDKGGT